MIDHLSFSQINMYSRCGIQYYWRYVEGKKIPPRSATVLGDAFHIAQERNYKQKLDTKRDLSLEEVISFFVDTWKARSTEIAWQKNEIQKYGSPKRAVGILQDEGISLVNTYYNMRAVNIQPVAVEDEIIISFLNDYPPVKGYIDLIDEQAIRETKTVSRTPTQEVVDKSLQLTIYAIGYKLKYGEERSLVADYIVRKKNPEVVSFITKRTQDYIDRFLSRFARVVEGIQKGVFIPAPTDHWVCSPKWCGYWDICKERG
jgi:hypothetical protein